MFFPEWKELEKSVDIPVKIYRSYYNIVKFKCNVMLFSLYY